MCEAFRHVGKIPGAVDLYAVLSDGSVYRCKNVSASDVLFNRDGRLWVRTLYSADEIRSRTLPGLERIGFRPDPI